MQALLRNKKYSRKIFLGVIGSYLIETLDDDPIITKLAGVHILKSYQKLYPTHSTRFAGSTLRMVLKSFKGDALLILTCIDKLKSECHLFHFSNHGKQTDQQILLDALNLASFRWSAIRVDGISYALNKNNMPQMKEIQAILSSLKD